MATCPREDKTRYENRDAVRAAFRRLPRKRKRQGAHIYRCRGCGGWHIGRSLKRAFLTWKAEV